MKIPTWLDANEAVESGKYTPLDIFVLNNEPAGKEDEMKFRNELQAMIDYVSSNAPLPASVQEALNSGDGTYRP